MFKRESWPCRDGEGGMIRLETLIELKSLNSSFSSSNFSTRAFRAQISQLELFELKSLNSSFSSSNLSTRAFRAQISQLELFELKSLNSNFSSSNFSIRAFLSKLDRRFPVEASRAIRADSTSISSTLPPSYHYYHYYYYDY